MNWLNDILSTNKEVNTMKRADGNDAQDFIREKRLYRMEKQQVKLEKKICRIEKRQEKLEKKMDKIEKKRWLFGDTKLGK